VTQRHWQSSYDAFQGPQVMPGYWNKPEVNAAAFTADAYFRTGDIGAFDVVRRRHADPPWRVHYGDESQHRGG
jgi:hypothetical protein